MKNAQLASNRKFWNQQHVLLRRLLEKEHDLTQARAVFSIHHAMVHSARLQVDGHCSFQDEVLRGLSDAQMRAIPTGKANSVAWMVWHITRIEDATMNVLIADAPQIFQRGHWQAKIASPFVDVGNAMSAQEIRALSETLNLKALLAYRLAVGKRTRQIVARITMETLQSKPSPERLNRLMQDGTVRPQAEWLLKYWGGHPQTNLLLMPATRHGFVHFNEIERMLPRLRKTFSN